MPHQILSKWLFTLLALLGCVAGNVQADEEEIVVSLDTETPLMPLYLPPLIAEETQLSSSYIQQLEKVLAFDLEHNGHTFLVKRTPTNDRLATPHLGQPSVWKEQNIFYVVKGEIQGNSLLVSILDVDQQKRRTTDPINLTGQLNKDRRSLHKLADTIQKAFFGTEGIASSKILFSLRNEGVSTAKNQVSEIWEVDYDGANARQLTHDLSYNITPVYIPPKPGLASGGFLYVSYQIGQPKIYAASIKEGVGHRVTSLKGSQLMPNISRQRNTIAFISDVTGNPDLFIQDFSPETGIKGKPQQIFSAKQATQGSPCFSPDGKKIVFVSNKDGSPKIYMIAIPLPGSSLKDVKATLITKINRENSAPAWSPDGTKLAYCARTKDARQIWIYDFITNKERQVTSGSGNKENPSWAADSLHLVFNSADKGDSQLYIINLNQAEAFPITSGKGDKRFPNWEPS